MITIVGLAGGPEPGGRTSTAVAAVPAGAAGVTTHLVELGSAGPEDVAAAIGAADAVVIGSPVYRATYSALLKATFERTGRGSFGESSAPCRARWRRRSSPARTRTTSWP